MGFRGLGLGILSFRFQGLGVLDGRISQQQVLKQKVTGMRGSKPGTEPWGFEYT